MNQNLNASNKNLNISNITRYDYDRNFEEPFKTVEERKYFDKQMKDLIRKELLKCDVKQTNGIYETTTRFNLPIDKYIYVSFIGATNTAMRIQNGPFYYQVIVYLYPDQKQHNSMSLRCKYIIEFNSKEDITNFFLQYDNRNKEFTTKLLLLGSI